MPTDHELNSLIAECWVDLLTIASRERARYPEASDDPASLLGEAMTRVLGQSAPVENAMHLKGLTTVFLRRTAIDRIRRRRVDRKAKAALRTSCEIETRPSREREEMRADALADVQCAHMAILAFGVEKISTRHQSSGHGLRALRFKAVERHIHALA